jgi:hypothetical protein
MAPVRGGSLHTAWSKKGVGFTMRALRKNMTIECHLFFKDKHVFVLITQGLSLLSEAIEIRIVLH